MSLKNSLKGNSALMNADKVLPRGKAAGLPSGFQSNVTARNQFSKVLTRPTDVSSIEEGRIIPRGSSGSSSSPYRAAAIDVGDMHNNVANDRTNEIYSKKSGFTPNAAFNRFASDKNLLGL